MKVGDIFVIPIDDGRAGVGQIVEKIVGGIYYFAVFEDVVPIGGGADDALKAIESPIRYLILSLDGKLYARHWTVVAWGPVQPGIPFPAYKEHLNTFENVQVVDHLGRRHRTANLEEQALLPYRTTYSPIHLEFVLRAHLGLDPWQAKFDEFVPNPALSSAAMFGGQEH